MTKRQESPQQEQDAQQSDEQVGEPTPVYDTQVEPDPVTARNDDPAAQSEHERNMRAAGL